METLKEKKDKILVIQTAFPGDALLTLPMIKILKLRSAAAVDVVCIPATRDVFDASPYIDRVIVMDKRGEHRSFFSLYKLAKKLSAENYSKIYSPHKSFRSALLVMFTGVKESFGFDNSALKFVYSKTIKYDYKAHEVKRNLQLIEEDVENEKWKIIPEINITSAQQKKIDEFILTNNLNGFVAVAPASVWATKRYPADYYSMIIKFLLNIDKKVLLIGSKEDINLCEEIARDYPDVIIAAGVFTLPETAALLKHADLLICNDSAPTHLGMCADIPVLTIYCSTVADFGFYPYNNKSSWISYDDLTCKPCGIHGYQKCPVNTFDCGILLKPEIVLTEMEKLIGNKKLQHN